MRSITFGEGESGAEILLDHGVLHLSEDGGIDFLLELLSGISEGLLWSVFSEELLGFSSDSFALLLEGLIGDGVGLDSGHINLGGGSHGVALVHSLDWDTIDLVWAGDGEESALELLEHDDSLSLESSGEEDKDLAWCDTCSELWSFWSVSLWSLFDIICWVPIVFLDHLSSK